MLLTRFLDDDGVAEVSDFMPVDDAGRAHNLVRRAKTVRGEVVFRMRCAPRFDYARATHTVELRGATEVMFVGQAADARAGAAAARVGAHADRGRRRASREFTLARRRDRVVRARGGRPGAVAGALADHPDYHRDAFKATINFWRALDRSRTYRGRWREMVNRSALTLKLLTSHEHGSIVAAPTFGLPEQIGGVRNWDYRYTWIRDASFTLYGLMRLGYTEEAAAFMRWIEQRCAELEPDGSLQIMYGIDGRHELPEETLPHLEGYMGSRPVRIGNARVHAAPARHLRRADGLGLPLRQVRRADLARPVAQRRAADRLGVRALARARRGHLGGARRAAGVPLLARDVLGGDRSRDPPRQQALAPGAARALARASATRSTTTSSRASGIPKRQAFVQHNGATHARRRRRC